MLCCSYDYAQEIYQQYQLLVNICKSQDIGLRQSSHTELQQFVVTHLY